MDARYVLGLKMPNFDLVIMGCDGGMGGRQVGWFWDCGEMVSEAANGGGGLAEGKGVEDEEGLPSEFSNVGPVSAAEEGGQSCKLLDKQGNQDV